MKKPIDPDTLKIPAYMRKNIIISQSRQKLILTALDRKEAGLKPNSKRALAPKKTVSKKRRELNLVDTVQKTSNTLNFATPAKINIEKSKKLTLVGATTHYIENINVAIILLTNKGLKVGNTILVEGDKYLFTQHVEEIQIDRTPVKRAKRNDHIGLKVDYPAIKDGKVYLLG